MIAHDGDEKTYENTNDCHKIDPGANGPALRFGSHRHPLVTGQQCLMLS